MWSDLAELDPNLLTSRQSIRLKGQKSLNSSFQYSHTIVKCSCLELLRIHINRASLKYLPFPWNVVLPSASLCCHYTVYGQCRPVEKDKYILKTKTNLSISYNETDAATGLINRPLIKFFPVSFHTC